MSTLARLEEHDCQVGYDAWAPHYDEDVNPMIAAVEHALDAHPPRWSGAAVLELGCGTGRNLARALARGALRATGVDLSSGMLAIAASKLAGAPVTLLRGDARRELPLPDGDVDLLLISLVLEHLDAEGVGAVVAQAARLLRSGGRLRVCEIHPQLRGDGVAAHFQDPGSGAEIHLPSHRHDLAELGAALVAAGLEVERSTDWFAAGALLDRCPKLARHRGKAVLLDVTAVRAV